VGNYGLNTVFVIAFLIGSMTTLFDGAMFSMIPSLVPEDRLADGNGFVAASQQINFAVGPLVAGVLVATTGGPELGLFINGASFAASAISLKWVGRVPLHRPSSDERAPFFTEAANGLRYIWREPRLRITTIASAIPNFVMGFVEATLLLLAQWVLGAQNMTEVGILVAAMGVGGVIGALVAPRVAERVGVGRTMIAGMGITGIGLLALVFTSYGVIAIALQIGWMAGVSLINVPLATIRQHYSAPSMMGRVISASRALGWATLPIGALVGGWLGADAESYPNIARTFPILLIGTAIWLMSTIVWRDTYGPRSTASVAETTAGAEA
jgi:Na+/melibiose symporter-like transporter